MSHSRRSEALPRRQPEPQLERNCRALSDAGVWALGTLQTDADRQRLIDGLASGDRKANQVLDNTVQQLANPATP